VAAVAADTIKILLLTPTPPKEESNLLNQYSSVLFDTYHLIFINAFQRL
jgi:hypothetical protein